MLPQSIFPSCSNLFLNSAFDVLDSIELGSWFQISMPQKCREFVSTAPFLTFYRTSLSLKKDHMNIGLVVTVPLYNSLSKEVMSYSHEILANHDKNVWQVNSSKRLLMCLILLFQLKIKVFLNRTSTLNAHNWTGYSWRYYLMVSYTLKDM